MSRQGQLDYQRIERIEQDVARELDSATEKFGSLKSLHEAYAVIKEELEEAWDEIKLKHPDLSKVRHELIQLAAMAERAILDCVDGEQ